ncbi:HAD family hydrolase [soil metagenome]
MQQQDSTYLSLNHYHLVILATHHYQHVVAWELAFRDADHDSVDMADLHRLIGRASEDLVEEVLGKVDDEVVEGHSRRYDELRELIEPRGVRCAADLVRACAERGLRVVLATSGSEDDLEWMLPAIGAGDHVYGVTTSDKVEQSKPAPDLLEAAAVENDLDLAQTAVVGDTVWDVEAARRLGVDCVALTCGGVGERDLRAAGAQEVWANPEDVLANLERSLLGRLGTSARS